MSRNGTQELCNSRFDFCRGIPLYAVMFHQTFVDNHCKRLPDTERVQPFGPETVVWRVAGHMFAAYIDGGQGVSLRSNTMTAALSGPMQPNRDPASYLAGGGWVTVPWETGIDTLRAQIDMSYRLVLRDWSKPVPTTDPAD
jgi:predicted DNA-binding protein (MmcQ/YjbR family)